MPSIVVIECVIVLFNIDGRIGYDITILIYFDIDYSE